MPPVRTPDLSCVVVGLDGFLRSALRAISLESSLRLPGTSS